MKNNAELLINIARKAPWILDEDKTFLPEKLSADTLSILRSITDFELTLIIESGRVFKQYLRVSIAEGRVLIDRPFEWDDTVSSCHVFFRNADKRWSFFQATRLISDTDTISAEIPAEVYLVQRRRFKRALAPIGTKILFRNDNGLIDSAFVHDISEGGLLVWSGGSRNGYRLNSQINEIFISLPVEAGDIVAKTGHRVLPYITRGEVVRVDNDSSSSISHYGISFIHDNILLYRRLNSLVTHLKDLPAASLSTVGESRVAPKLQ